MEQVTLDHVRWRAQSPHADEIVQRQCNVTLDVATPCNCQHALTFDTAATVDEHGDTPWMASRRKEWESIQGALSTSRFQRPNRSARTCLPASGSAVRSGTVATIRDLLLLAVILGDTVGLKMEAAAATPKMSTLRLLLALAAQHDLDIDLCNAVQMCFLEFWSCRFQWRSCGDLGVEIYMEYPKGLERPARGCVPQLQKSIHGLKSASCDCGHLL